MNEIKPLKTNILNKSKKPQNTHRGLNLSLMPGMGFWFIRHFVL